MHQLAIPPERFSREAACTSFTAEPGQRYYFRARITLIWT
jgi:hypothetical protein